MIDLDWYEVTMRFFFSSAWGETTVDLYFGDFAYYSNPIGFCDCFLVVCAVC